MASSGLRRSLFRQTQEKVSQGSLHFHEILSHDYPLFEGSPYLTLKSANTLAGLIDKYEIELVNAHYAIPHATSAILARDAGLPIKVVTTLHGTDVTTVGVDPAYRFTTQHALKCSDAVTAVSSFLAEQARQSFGVSNPIHVIPNWVDTARFSPYRDASERSKYAQPEELIVIHASNFRAVKNSLQVIEVFSKVLKTVPARLLLVGEGPDKASCISRAVELGISGRVLSLPPMIDIERLLRISDVLLLPSLSESLGLIILEAMSTEVFCVCSNVGGIPEVITHGETGVMFDPKNTDDMTSAIISSYHNHAETTTIRKQAREFVNIHHNPLQLVSRYLDVFEDVLQHSVRHNS